MHEVIRLGLVDREFIADRTSNYDALAKLLEDYTPERAEQITGVDADTIRLVARLRARPARASSSGAWASPSTRPAPTTPAA